MALTCKACGKLAEPNFSHLVFERLNVLCADLESIRNRVVELA
jgi:hypothetical protein